MFAKESLFEDHLINLLKESRSLIVRQFRPFSGLKLSIDLKSHYNQLEEWRELKIIYYTPNNRNLQNLWKGIGKVEILRRLAETLFEDEPRNIKNILSIPQFDFSKLNEEISSAIIDLVNLEVVSFNEIVSYDEE